MQIGAELWLVAALLWRGLAFGVFSEAVSLVRRTGCIGIRELIVHKLTLLRA